MHPIIITNTINQYLFNIDLVHSLLPHIGKLLFFDINIFLLSHSRHLQVNLTLIREEGT